MKSEKPEAQSPAPFRGYTACTASPFCRYPGRIPLDGMYVCVEHFSTDKRRHEIANWNLGVPNAK